MVKLCPAKSYEFFKVSGFKDLHARGPKVHLRILVLEIGSSVCLNVKSFLNELHQEYQGGSEHLSAIPFHSQ